MVEMVEIRKMMEVAVLVEEDLLESKNPLEWQGCPAVFVSIAVFLYDRNADQNNDGKSRR